MCKYDLVLLLLSLLLLLFCQCTHANYGDRPCFLFWPIVPGLFTTVLKTFKKAFDALTRFCAHFNEGRRSDRFFLFFFLFFSTPSLPFSFFPVFLHFYSLNAESLRILLWTTRKSLSRTAFSFPARENRQRHYIS